MPEERWAFYDAVGDFNTGIGSGPGVLFVPVAASSALRAVAPGDVRANIRACRHYIEVVPPGAPPPESDPQLGYAFAQQCRDDASLPMKDVVVLENAPQADLPGFQQRVRALLARWLAELQAGPGPS